MRWYLRYALSYRDLEEMMRDRGLSVDQTTIFRWVQRYAPEIDKRCRPLLKRTNDSYRVDEPYVRVGGAWTYLYRGVDSNGDTLDFLLREKRDVVAARALFRKRSYLRQCKHLSNVVEQDHRFVKRRTRPMPGFKAFATARRTLRGIEMMNALRKGQARWITKGDVVGQTRLIHQVFGVVT